VALWARACIAGLQALGRLERGGVLLALEGNRRWPSPQPSPSRTTKTTTASAKRKGAPVTDVKDAAWLAQMGECGLLRGSFVPPAVIRELRDLTRYRKRLIQTHTAETQRIHKTLEDARSGSARSPPTCSGLGPGTAGRPGRRGARPGGPRRAGAGRLRNKLPELVEALRGRFDAHHALLLRLALEHAEQLERSTAALDAEVDRVIAPFARARDHLDTTTGVGKRAAECIIAEIGVDMGVFPPPATSPPGRAAAPATTPTGGKRRSGKPTKGNRWLGEILVKCAWAAAHSHDTYLAAQFWRLARRIGKNKAAGAVGHSILVIAWHLLEGDCDHAELGGDFFVQRDTDRARQRAVTQLQALGYHVTLKQTAA
jgi:transposase